MLTITIAGSQYPVHFGMHGLAEFCKKTGRTFGEIVSSADAISSLEGLVAVATLGLNEGARKAGIRNAKTFTEDDVWDAVDENPRLLLDVHEAFSLALKPIIEKLDGVVDPNS